MENNNKQNIVVIDIGNQMLDGNKVFIPAEAVKVSHTILPICHLYERLTALGYSVVTPDIYLAMPSAQKEAALITFLVNSRTKQIIKAGAKPLAVICLESPFIASKFFVFLRLITRRFKYAVLFEGMRKMAGRRTFFFSARFPQAFRISDLRPREYAEKKLVTMISSNKSVNSLLKSVALKLCYGQEVREIYSERLKIIRYFSSTGNFDLFGYGWDKGAADDELNQGLKKCYKGSVASKAETIRNYKFAICFENAIFPGYVTEKIFDALVAGVVPIYYGAPDIADYVNSGAFIDYTKYDSPERMYEYIEKMTKAEYEAILEEGKRYLATEKFKEFTQEKFAEKIIDMLKPVNT